MSKVRKAYTLEEKVKMIKACEVNSLSKVSEEFSIAMGTLHGYVKNKDKFLKQYENSSRVNLSQKRQLEGINPDIEEAT